MGNKDLVGFKFGLLTVLKKNNTEVRKRKDYLWECLCDCGGTRLAYTGQLTNNSVKSCGCLVRCSKGKIVNGCTVLEKHSVVSFNCGERVNWICACECGNFFTSYNLSRKTLSCGCKHNLRKGRVTHGLSKTKTYEIWKGLFSRCYNPKRQYYYLYGGSGVTVCERWSEPNGEGFVNFLEDMGEKPEGLSLNRVNGAKVYSKENCEWATSSVQAFDQKIRKSNQSGKTGVSWSKSSKRWKAQIMIEKKVTCLGSFINIEDAIQCRRNAELTYYGFTKD